MPEPEQAGDTWSIAERFLAQVHRETGLPMIVCDHTGTIVRAVDRSRIGKLHAGAQRILADEAEEAAVTAEEAAKNPQVKEGYSCPICIGSKRVGTFGITGPLAITRPLARTAALVLATWMQEREHRQAVHRTAEAVMSTVKEVSARLGRTAAGAASEAAALSATAKRATDGLGCTDRVVHSVHQVAEQSRILALNGSIEAARAGARGAAFSVVAHEMLGLSREAAKAADQIQVRLDEIRAAVGEAAAAADRSSATSREQGVALKEIEQAFAQVRDTLEGLDKALGA